MRWLGVTGHPKGKTRIPSMTNLFSINARVIVLKNVTRGLNKQIAKIQGATEMGVRMAVEYLRNNTETIPPLVPVSNDIKEKHLRETWYCDVKREGLTTLKAEFGYTAPYAFYVHEMTAPPYGDVQWTRPGSGSKWLEKAIQRDKPAMLGIIKENINLSTL